MSWFKRHLNWTAVFGALLGNLIFGFSALVMGYWIGWLFSIAVTLAIFVWVAKQKNQHWAWAFIILVPALGLIVFLGLPNKTPMFDIQNGKLVKLSAKQQNRGGKAT